MLPPIEAVCGFMFSPDKSSVVLIRKNRPAFQEGRFNGVGGKVDPGDHGLPIIAMVREFREETGVKTMASDWERFAVVETPGWRVYMYRAVGDLAGVRTMTDEQVYVVSVSELRSWETLRNVQWLVPLCLDDSRYDLPIMIKETA